MKKKDEKNPKTNNRSSLQLISLQHWLEKLYNFCMEAH